MPIEYRREGAVAVLTLAHPPVNALGLDLRRALHSFFMSLPNDETVQAAVIRGSGKGFCAGGDRMEFGKPKATARPTLSRDVLQAIEGCGKPVVAAIHGFAVGGGLELALACGLRVGVMGSKLGLPEVGIGRFPLSGSQRLPRLVGVARAARWMLQMETFLVGESETAPMLDRSVDRMEDLLPTALEMAHVALTNPPTLLRDRPFLDKDPRAAFAEVAVSYPVAQLSPAQQAVLAALRGAVEARNFQGGLDRAQALFDELVNAGEQR